MPSRCTLQPYQLRYRSGGGGWQTLPPQGTATTRAVPDRTPGVTYTFELRAIATAAEGAAVQGSPTAWLRATVSMPLPMPPPPVLQRTDSRGTEAAVYESALSHLRKRLYLKLCVVCLTEPRKVVFVHPNGIEHTLCCSGCAHELYRQRQPCPICRQPLGRLERADRLVDRTIGAPRPGRRAAALDATQLPNMPWAIDASQAVQLRAKEPAVALNSPELELERRPAELRPESGYRPEYLLGGGAFGAVYAGRRRGVLLAAKTFHAVANPDMYGLSNPANLNAILQDIMCEVNALVGVDHDNIIHFAGVAYTTRNGRVLPEWILSEYAAGGTLHARIYEGQPLSEQLITKYTKEAARAFEYLHDNVNMIHCDIKPKNVLLSIDDRIKIADLGITKVMQRIGTVTNTGTMTMCGTPIYMAPECAASEAYTASRDSYAWGLVMAEIFLKEEPPPFSGTAPRPPDYQFGPGHEQFVNRAAPRAGGLRQIMINCTKEHSQQRPTAAQVLASLR